MNEKIFNYTKTCRKKTGLSRKEVAYLFGMKSGYFICKTEQGNNVSGIYRAIAYQILFDKKIDVIFAELPKKVGLEIIKRIAKLSNELETKHQSAATKRKLKFLDAAAINIATNFKKYENK
jgi:hypothetical protein